MKKRVTRGKQESAKSQEPRKLTMAEFESDRMETLQQEQDRFDQSPGQKALRARLSRQLVVKPAKVPLGHLPQLKHIHGDLPPKEG